MAQGILIIAESGSGKSTSIENLDPAETFIINEAIKLYLLKGGERSMYSGVKITQKVIYIQLVHHNK